MDNDIEDVKIAMLDQGKSTIQNRYQDHHHQGEKFKQYVASISVSLGAVCTGTVLAWTSPILPQLIYDNNSTNINPSTIILNEQEEALVGGILPIGAFIAAVPIGYLADRFGRKLTILLTSLLFIINWLLIIFSLNSTCLIVGRLFAGMATGGVCVVVPMYIGEIADSSIRGTLSTFFQMFLCIGILITCIIGSLTNWIYLSVILLLIPIIFGLSFFFMPESPVYLIKINQLSKGERVLRNLRGDFYDINIEIKAIQKEMENFHRKKVTINDVLKSSANRRALVAVLGVMIFQQLCGINVIVFYTAPIFKAAGSTISPNLAGIIIALVQVLTSYLSIMIIEKANRKFYLLLSSTGMGLFLAALGMYFHLKYLDTISLDSIKYIPIGSLVLFMVSFSIGFGPIPWIIIGEVLSAEIKGIACGFAVLTNWLFAFLVTYFYPIMTGLWGTHNSFYLFGGFNAIATLFVYYLVPETRGRTFLEIQTLLSK